MKSKVLFLLCVAGLVVGSLLVKAQTKSVISYSGPMGLEGDQDMIHFTNGSAVRSAIGPFTGPGYSGVTIYGTNGDGTNITSYLDVYNTKAFFSVPIEISTTVTLSQNGNVAFTGIAYGSGAGLSNVAALTSTGATYATNWTGLTDTNQYRGTITTATNATYATNWTGLADSNNYRGAFTGNLTGLNTYAAEADVAFVRKAVTSLVNGDNAAVPVGTNVFVEVSGPTAAFTIHGINGSPNRDGKLVIIENNTGYNLTVANQSGIEPTAGNRILTGLSADAVYTNIPAVVTLIYNGNAARWVVVSHN